MKARLIAIVICLITLSHNVIASEIVNVDRQSWNTIIIPQTANRNIIQSTQVVTAAVASIPAVQKLAESAGPVVQRYAQQLQAMGQRAAHSAQITFKTAHAARPGHLPVLNISVNQIENAISSVIQKVASNVEVGAKFTGRIIVEGVTIQYNAFRVSLSRIDVGSYWVPPK